jgi:hypothetical protein
MGKIGIYVNAKRMQAFRASTTHSAPDDPDWILVSEDSMIGMVQVRSIARERQLVNDPEALQWTGRTDELASDK